MITLNLPYPPTLNSYYRHLRSGPRAGAVLISEKGRKYRESIIRTVPRIARLEGRLEVDMDAYPPDNRRRDVDGIFKCVLDSLTHAGIWTDDSQIDRLCVTRRETIKLGALVMRIRTYAPTQKIGEA
jgi:crossover junction endodeoxyribonuclease RusA